LSEFTGFWLTWFEISRQGTTAELELLMDHSQREEEIGAEAITHSKNSQTQSAR